MPLVLSKFRHFQFSALCGRPVASESKHVAGGVAVIIQDWPWVVRIEIRNLGQFSTWCTGTLIEPTLVLSAAHCLDHVQTEDIRLVLGSDHVKKDNQYWRQVRTIVNFEKHPKYDSQFGYFDVALITIQEVPLSQGINTICLPQSAAEVGHDTISKDTFGYLVGWGSLSLRKPPSETLQLAYLRVFNKQYCDSKYRRSQTSILPDLFKPNIFCAGYVVSLNFRPSRPI